MGIFRSGNPVPSRVPLAGDAPGYVTTEVNVDDKTNYERVRLYNASANAIAKNTPCTLLWGIGASGSLSVNAPMVSGTAEVDYLVVADEAVAATSFGWFAFRGFHDVAVNASSAVGIGDFLKIQTGTDSARLMKDGTAKTTKSVAIAGGILASGNGTVRVYLIGDKVISGA